MARVGVFNSSPLIVLGSIGRFDLIQAAFDRLVSPPEVAAEVRSFPNDLVAVQPVTNRPLLNALCTQMDTGEAAAIALGTEVGGAIVVLDDRKGRRAARGMGLPVVGTIGLVVEAKRSGRIDQARPVVEALLAAGLFVSDAIVHRALAEIGE